MYNFEKDPNLYFGRNLLWTIVFNPQPSYFMKGNIDYIQCKSAPKGMVCPKKAGIISKIYPLMNDENSRMYWAALPDNINSIYLADQRESGE